jgi:hypothetical protein
LLLAPQNNKRFLTVFSLASGMSTEPEVRTEPFTLDDLAEIEDIGILDVRNRKLFPTKKAEMLVDEVVNPIHSMMSGKLVWPGMSLDIVYEGRLRDGTVVRTKSIVYHPAEPKNKKDDLGKRVADYVANNFPQEGDVVTVAWDSPELIPRLSDGARTVEIMRAIEHTEIYGPSYGLNAYIVDGFKKFFTDFENPNMRIRRGPRPEPEPDSIDSTVEARLPWEILPPGRNTEERVRRFYSEALQIPTTAESTGIERQIHPWFDFFEHKPTDVGIGIRGNTGYVAFVYTQNTVFDNPRHGNAIYIIPTNGWIENSKLPKAELREKEGVRRIVHDPDRVWMQSIVPFLN